MSNFRKIAVKLASLEGSTKHLSLSFAVGVLIGFSPFMGLHTVIALSLCFLTRINKPSLMIGCFINMPWVTVPYYTFSAWLGTVILGMPGVAFPAGLGISDILSSDFPGWLLSQRVLLIPAFTGSLLLAGILAVLAYITASMTLVKFRKHGMRLPKPLDNRFLNLWN
jgi:uncharacterized protein (DUF2062 family)